MYIIYIFRIIILIFVANMTCGNTKVYLGKPIKGLSSTSQPPEEGRSVQRLKRCDKHGDKDEDNNPESVSNVKKSVYIKIQNSSELKFRVLVAG